MAERIQRMETTLMYKPLPESLTIKQSGINGLGLFARESLKQGMNLGMSHIKIADQIIRTPLGGFINHSNTPNCEKASLLMTNQFNPDHKYDYKKWNLITTKDIEKGDELTVQYTFYKI